MENLQDIWAKLTDPAFVHGADGRTAYYPWGRAIRGYWIDSPAREQALRAEIARQLRILRIWVPVAALAPGIGILVRNYLEIALFFAALILAFAEPYLRILEVTKGLERAPPLQPRLRPSLKRVAAALSVRRLILMLVFGAGMAVVFAQAATAPGVSPIAAALFFLIFVILLIHTAALLVTKLRMRRTGEVLSPADREWGQQFQQGKSLFRRLQWPVWFVVAALLIWLVVLLAAYPTERGTGSPRGQEWLHKF